MARPFANASGAEFAALALAVAVAVAIGLVLDSLVLGFLTLIVIAALARLVLAILRTGGDGGSPRTHPHEHARSQTTVS